MVGKWLHENVNISPKKNCNLQKLSINIFKKDNFVTKKNISRCWRPVFEYSSSKHNHFSLTQASFFYQVNLIKFLFRIVFNTSLGGCGHTSVKNILLYWKKAHWNSILAVFKGVCAGINPENRHQKILWISFRNTHAHNRCRIIGGSERLWNLFAYLCTYKSLIYITMTGNKTIWKNGNREYNEKCIYCFF